MHTEILVIVCERERQLVCCTDRYEGKKLLVGKRRRQDVYKCSLYHVVH